MEPAKTPLPIDEVLPDLRAALRREGAAVLVAPPGAGKTTRAPLELLADEWASRGKIILLEPRRLAARAAAARMAQTLGQDVGRTIGLRIRMETRASAASRIEVVTEGVFTRMIVDDPSLEGVAGVIFDEFHERSLDGDLGLALAAETRTALRPDLRLLAMSATIDGADLAAFLRCPAIESRGRAFPVETVYLGRDPGERVEQAVARAVKRALARDSGSILAFLPGRAEIDRTGELIRPSLDDGVDVAPLHGGLDRAGQDFAVRPAGPGRRKIVLATSIAESSLTIEGVRIVIDSGLARVPRFEPGVGLTRLETIRASRASVDQRRGRAGRTEPGLCYRLWDEAATGGLAPFPTPEIRACDLASTVLDLAACGIRSPDALAWLEPPPLPAWMEARKLLDRLGATDSEGSLSDLGRAMRALPMEPRLARMTCCASPADRRLACEIAAVLTERRQAGTVDLEVRVRDLRRDSGFHASELRRMARAWAQSAGARPDVPGSASVGGLIALAFPDRIAKARAVGSGQFLMANGRAARLDPAEAMARETWIVVAETAGRAESPRIMAAAALTAEEAKFAAGPDWTERDEIRFDPAAQKLRARRAVRLGEILVIERSLPAPSGPDAAIELARAAVRSGGLPWSDEARAFQARVSFVRKLEGESWPDLSDLRLAECAEAWLTPVLLRSERIEALRPEDLVEALRSQLDWRLTKRLDELAPATFVTPAGSAAPIDYRQDGGPAVSVRVQELFGLARHPALAGGRTPLVLHLLSPARRPIQITRDLPGFWKGSWARIAAEMRGRYPRHFWPDDPATAPPTRRARPRS